MSEKEDNKLASSPLPEDAKQYLHRIGLSFSAIALYELLLRNGRLSAQDAAEYNNDFASAQYRLFYDLESRQLVRRIAGRPLRFEALPLRLGLASSFQDNNRELEYLIRGSLKSDNLSQPFQLIMGRRDLYAAYVRYADKAKHEIWLYSIGIAFSDKLEATQRSAIKRGVSIRHVIQQRKLSNQHVVAKWLRAGVRLRYLKQPRGFHFFIIDSSIVCLTFSDPNDTDKRLSIITSDGSAIELFRGQFRDIWDKAVNVEQ